MIGRGGIEGAGFFFFESCLPYLLPQRWVSLLIIGVSLKYSVSGNDFPASLMSPFSCSWCCVYTHTATYLTNHRDGKREREQERGRRGGGQRGRETETEQAEEREERRGRERERKQKETERERHRQSPPTRQQTAFFPYPAKCNSSNAATGSVLPD